MNFLAEIVARKLEDSLRLFESGVAEAFKAEIARRPAPISLKAALDGAAGPAIIAEVKRASPSKGDLAWAGTRWSWPKSTRRTAPRPSRS